MKTQPLWDTVPFSLLRQTPSPRGSPALGGWGRTENPNPVGRSLSWENSTGRQALPSRKAERPGSRGVSGGSGKETQRLLTFLSFPHSGSAFPGPPQEETATFSRSADCAETPTLLSPWPCTSLSQRPSPRHRHRHSPEAILPEPGGVCGRLPARVRTTGKLGSQGRGGGLNPDPGQVAPRIPGSGTEMEEVRQSFKIARRRETDLGGPRPLN